MAGLFSGEFDVRVETPSRRTFLITWRTWSGNSEEQWSSAQGLESVLISIQSLMSSNPYMNEPGFAKADSEEDTENMKNYTAKVISQRFLQQGFSDLLI